MVQENLNFEEGTQVEESDIHHTNAKQHGNDAETWVKDRYSLEGQRENQFPTFAHDVFDPRSGTPGEVKSCQIRYNGSGGRGRFQIWDYAHRELLNSGGFYVFVVHEPRVQPDQMHVYFHRPLSAATVDELIEERTSWQAIDHNLRPDQAHRTEISQSAIFTDIDITRISEEQAHKQNGSDPEESQGSDPANQEAGIPQVERVNEIIEIIRELEAQHDEQLANKSKILAEAGKRGIGPDTAQHHIDELKKRGEIYMPRDGAFRVT